MSSNSSSPRLFVSSMIAPIILEIFRLSLELIGPRWFTLNHQFSPSHLHFPPPSSLPDDDSVICLLSFPFLFSPSSSSTLLPKRSTFFCNDSKPLRSLSSAGLTPSFVSPAHSFARFLDFVSHFFFHFLCLADGFASHLAIPNFFPLFLP